MKLVNKKKVFELVEKGAMLVDLRSPIDFRNGSVQGSVNLPLRNFNNKLGGLNKNQKIILFTNDINDKDLKIAENYAEQMGFSNIFITEYRQLIVADKNE